MVLTSNTVRDASFVFCSSTAAIVNEASPGEGLTIFEDLPRSEHSALPMGYARAKWVAEQMCARAYEGPLRGRVTIARVGQLCGDSVHGVWNESEAIPVLIATSGYVGCLPTLSEVRVYFESPVASVLTNRLSVSILASHGYCRTNSLRTWVFNDRRCR